MTKFAVFSIVAWFVCVVWDVRFRGAALLGLMAMLSAVYILFMFTHDRTHRQGSS